MSKPIYVPAPPGQEAVFVSIDLDADECPTASDIDITRYPVVAWQIDPTDPDKPHTLETHAVPVLPYHWFTGEAGSFLLITMASGRVYLQSSGHPFVQDETHETLDGAILRCLRSAQFEWKKQRRKEQAAA